MSIIYDKKKPDDVAHSEQLYESLLAHMRENRLQQYRAGLQSWNGLFKDAWNCSA